MFKLDRKLIITASAAAALAIIATGCMGGSSSASTGSTEVNGAPTVDGGMVYPVKNSKTGPYYVNTDSSKGGYTNGRVPTANELAAWDKDVMPDGTGLPEGSGSVEDGEELYEAQCVSCHGDFGSGGGGYPALSKGNAVELQQTLTNNRWKDPEADGPVRVFGSYWPQVSTLWWYIKDGMPHPKSKTLSDDETYALTAYILNINEMEIDGEEVDDEYILDREKFLKIKMPNVDGFEPNIDGPDALKRVRAYYANPTNFGALNLNKGAERCMTNCQKETVKIRRIQNGGIKDFLPPMDSTRSLPKEEAALDVKAVYADNCAMCHGNGVGPGFGASAEWAAYTAKGMDKVYANGINGTDGGMPPKGGSTLSDADFKSVVDYLINGK
ncbi:MAG: c-type cytochrome [Campylobacterota bacterium]|nr:c-type cytochrome [Campylobacterota bacterium]